MEVLKKRMGFILKEEGIQISFDLFQIGPDYLLVATGGDGPHIGAVTLGEKDHFRSLSAGTHKEAIVTESMYEILRERTSAVIWIAGGIHVDHITKQQIQLVKKLCLKAANQIGDWFEQE